MQAFTDIGYAFCTFCAHCNPEKHNLFSFSLSPDAFSQKFSLFWSGLSSVASLDARLLSHLYMRKRHFGVSYKTLLSPQSMAAEKETRRVWRYDCCCCFCTRLCLYPLFHFLVQYIICFCIFLCLSINSFPHFLCKEKQFIARKQ